MELYRCKFNEEGGEVKIKTPINPIPIIIYKVSEVELLAEPLIYKVTSKTYDSLLDETFKVVTMVPVESILEIKS